MPLMTALALGITILIGLVIVYGALRARFRRGLTTVSGQLASIQAESARDRAIAQQEHKELTTKVDAVLADLRSIRRPA